MNLPKPNNDLRHFRCCFTQTMWALRALAIWSLIGWANTNLAVADAGRPDSGQLNHLQPLSESPPIAEAATQTLDSAETANQLPEQIQSLSGQLTTAEWLGPLAPVALSPFFGQAMLFGIASFGPDWLKERSNLISDGGPFDHPVLFFVFLALAVFTSLPRFTKVSKPIGLVAENLEAYSAIVTLVVIRFIAAASDSPMDPLEPLAAGFPELTIDVIMCIAAGLNIVVINLVKFFIELLVWLTPVPMVDAMLEAANKTICAALMGLYCYSPLLATILNLTMFAISALVCTKIVRRLRYYRSLIIGPILAYVWPSRFGESSDSMTAFAIQGFKSLPVCSKVTLTKTADSKVLVTGVSLWRKESVELEIACDETESGLVKQTREITTKDGEKYTFSHRRLVEQLQPTPATV